MSARRIDPSSLRGGQSAITALEEEFRDVDVRAVIDEWVKAGEAAVAARDAAQAALDAGTAFNRKLSEDIAADAAADEAATLDEMTALCVSGSLDVDAPLAASSARQAKLRYKRNLSEHHRLYRIPKLTLGKLEADYEAAQAASQILTFEMITAAKKRHAAMKLVAEVDGESFSGPGGITWDLYVQAVNAHEREFRLWQSWDTEVRRQQEAGLRRNPLQR